PLPDLAEARTLLEDTCTDSGVAAMTAELLRPHGNSLPPGLAESIPGPAAAWDGTTNTRGDSIPTYSDPSLSPWGPSLHFCFDEAEPRAVVANELPRIARRLAREVKPERIVL